MYSQYFAVIKSRFPQENSEILRLASLNRDKNSPKTVRSFISRLKKLHCNMDKWL